MFIANVIFPLKIQELLPYFIVEKKTLKRYLVVL